MSGSFETNVHSTDINDVLLNGKFSNVITVAKTGRANFVCSDYANDAACIQAALDHISNLGGGHLHITGGHYYCNSQLLYENSNLIWTGDGENTILDFTGAAAGLICIYIHGSISSINSLLTSNAGVSSLTVSVTDGSKFSANDWIRIRSNAIFYDNYMSEKLGEIQHISSISTNTLILKEVLFDSYNTSDTATVDTVNMIENITIKNLKMIATNSHNNYGIMISQAYNIYLTGLSFEDFSDRSIYIVDAVSSTITKNIFKRSNLAGLGYGITIDFCSRDITATHNKFYDCRHAIACGGGGTNAYGVQYNQIYTDNIQSYNSQGQGMFGMHPTYDGLIVSNNIVSYDGLGYFSGVNNVITNNTCTNVNTAEAAIRVDSYAQIANNRISALNAIMGIKIAPAHTTTDTNVQISNNQISVVGGYGVYTERPFNNLTIKNNTIYAAYQCIRLRDSAGASDSTNLEIAENTLHKTGTSYNTDCIYLDPSYNYTNVSITNNKMYSTGMHIYLRNTGARFSNILIENNVHNGGSFGVYVSSIYDAYIKGNKFNSVAEAVYVRSVGQSSGAYTISGNKFTSCTHKITDEVVATDRQITQNVGYVTENTGTATLLQNTTSIVVSHGLAAAPTRVQLTPTSSTQGIGYYVSAKAATTFTITMLTAPTVDVTFDWRVEV